MKLAEKYPDKLAKISNPAVRKLIGDIAVVDFDSSDLASYDAKNTILVGRDVATNEIFGLFAQFGFNHFVQEQKDDFFHHLFASVMMIKFPGQLMKNPFPLMMANLDISKNMTTEFHHTSLAFRESQQKPEVLAEVESFLLEEDDTNQIRESAMLIADELVSNALYHAPMDAQGNHLFSDVPRTTPVEYRVGQEHARLFLCNNERVLVIACRDPYGSVDLNHIKKKLFKQFSTDGGATTVSTGRGGAGIGCKLILDQCVGFYALVDKNKEALFCCTLPLKTSQTRRLAIKKNIHFCEYRG